MVKDKLMRYIPEYYKKDVVSIRKGETEWNDLTRRWNTLIEVEWADGEVCSYQNATYMFEKLKEFGRD